MVMKVKKKKEEEEEYDDQRGQSKLKIINGIIMIKDDQWDKQWDDED